MEFHRILAGIATYVHGLWPLVRIVWSQMLLWQTADLQGKPWEYWWKPLSRHGYHLQRGQFLDYGNRAYDIVFVFWCRLDPAMQALMVRFGVDFPTLDPRQEPASEHAYSMRGDIIECTIAALSGHYAFAHLWPWIRRESCWPHPTDIIDRFCDLCRLSQYLDAFLETGNILWCNLQVPVLTQGRMPLLRGDPLYEWRSTTWRQRQALFMRIYRTMDRQRIDDDEQ